MPRIARTCSSLNLYHIIIRGINKQDIFIDTQDKNKFIKEILIAKEKFQFKIYAYVIMPNHAHLIIKEGNTKISKIMHKIQLAYSEYLNIKYNRVGHVFQGRFYSKNIEDSEYLKTAIRYIHLNPDKAKIGQYNRYHWSSYASYFNNKSDLIDITDILKLFESEDKEAITLFEEFHKEKSDYSYNEEYSEFEICNKLDDEEVIKIIIENIGVESIYDIQKLNHKYRDEILYKILKIRGTTVKQVARITGLSEKIVVRAKVLKNN